MFLYTNTGDLLDVHNVNKVGLYLTGICILFFLKH